MRYIILSDEEDVITTSHLKDIASCRAVMYTIPTEVIKKINGLLCELEKEFIVSKITEDTII